MEGGSASVHLSDGRRTGGTGKRGKWRAGNWGTGGKGRTRATKPGLVQKDKDITYRLAVDAVSAVGVVERDSLDDTGDRAGARPSTNPRLLICWLGDGLTSVQWIERRRVLLPES